MKIGVAVLMVIVLAIPSVAKEIAIVVPVGYEDTEAPGAATAGGVTGDYRLQGVFVSSEFASLPASHQMLTGFYMRPDGLIGTPNSVSWPRFTLKLSTTIVTPENFNREFSANIGSDETLVYDSPISFTTANIGPRGGPKDFDIAIEFQNPFRYDPAQGNLLLDWIVYGPAAWVGHDEDSSTPIARWLFANGHDSLRGALSTGTPVISFMFAPEPTSLLSAVCCLFCLLLFGSRTKLHKESIQ